MEMFIMVAAVLCSFAKLCTVSPVDENIHTCLATCNEPLYHLHPLKSCRDTLVYTIIQ